MFIKAIKIFSVLIFASQVAYVAAQGSGTVLASVNGTKIYSSQVSDWVGSVVASGGQDTPELRQTMLNDLIVREVILQDAKKTGLANKEKNALKIQIAYQNTILELWFAQYAKDHPISDADVRLQYDQQALIARDPKNAKEYQLSQIVLASQVDGRVIINELNAGASFELLAKEKSLEKSSGSQGGLIGWVLPGRLTPPLNGTVAGLSKGMIDPQPIQVGKLWYVIKVNDVRDYKFPSYDQAKSSISQALLQKQKQEAINSLLKSGKIVIGTQANK